MQIIHKKCTSVETDWKKELTNSFTNLYELIEFLEIDEKTIPLKYRSEHTQSTHKSAKKDNSTLIQKIDFIKNTEFEGKQAIAKHSLARKLFPMRVPLPFAKLIEKGNWHDPLLQQVIPQYNEFNQAEGFIPDPLQEKNTSHNGLIHKYKSRVLLVVKGGCAVNCRYCFRRHFPYHEHQLNKKKYQDIFKYIHQDKSINEVILSGGDPLMAKDENLYWLVDQLGQIDHLKRLRIHTRLPVVIPNRVTSDLVSILKNSRLKVIMVLHINHANELSDDLKIHLQILKQADVTLLNQSVLLSGINNCSDTLESLSEALFESDIMPYYLHLLDPIEGASHFNVSKLEAIDIMQELLARLPGFLVPKLVQELPNRASKTPINLYSI